jgi:hypothetical protein
MNPGPRFKYNTSSKTFLLVLPDFSGQNDIHSDTFTAVSNINVGMYKQK